MHNSLLFIQDLAVVMVVAAFVTLLFRRLKQPVVLGYILAGFLIGPHTPPFSFIQDEASIRTLSELGVVLLMFSLGLHFSFQRLKQVGAPALLAALLEIICMIAIGYGVGRYFGWNETDALFLGAILSISSTTIIVKVLHEQGRSGERFAGLIFGILIMEDILGIALIALLSSIALTGTLQMGHVVDTLGRLGVFLVVTLVIGFLLVPPLLRYVFRFKSAEMMLVSVLGLCFGVSLFAIKLGYSVALGAFLIGAIIGEVRVIGRVDRLVEPVRDMFSALFFVSVGLLIDPTLLVQYWIPILVITLAVILGKVATCTFGTFIAGNDIKTSTRVGMGLAQIGEFSFIIAALGASLDVTSPFLYPIAVTVSTLTTFSTPYLIAGSDGFVSFTDRFIPKKWTEWIDAYPGWVERLKKGGKKESLPAKIGIHLMRVLLDLAMVSAVFFAADFFAEHFLLWWPHFSGLFGGNLNDELWIVAMVASLPFLIATFRRIYTLSFVFLLVGMALVAWWLVVISATLFPSDPVVIVFLVVLAGITALFPKIFMGIYLRAERALGKTLIETPSINGIPVFLKEQGPSDGVPVVFLHGFPLNHAMWDAQMAALPSGFRGVAYDLRGHGLSGAGDYPSAMETLVDDLIGVLDHLHIDKAVVCSLSMGGYVALRAVEIHPERFRGLVLCDTRAEADTNEGKLKRHQNIRLIQSGKVAEFAEAFLKNLVDPETFDRRPQWVQYLRNRVLSTPPEVLCWALLAMAGRTDSTASLSKITVPTLILTGERDVLTPPASAEAMHKTIAGSELRIIPNAGHVSNLENAGVFNQYLMEFLLQC